MIYFTGSEGFAKETDKEFSRGLWISKGSSAEVQSLCYAAFDQEYLKETDSKAIYDQAENRLYTIKALLYYLLKQQR